MENDNHFYVYAYLDPRKEGRFQYGTHIFGYEPFYIGIGKGKRDRCFSHLEPKNLNKSRYLNVSVKDRIKPLKAKNSNYKLSQNDIDNIIQKRIRDKLRIKEISKDFGISCSMVYYILKYKNNSRIKYEN